MNWLSLITGIENLIFWLASLIVLAPKTLYRVIRKPNSMITILSQELKKRPEERYNAYISPIIFWILFSIFLIILQAILYDYVGFIVGGVFVGGSTDIEHFEFDFSQNRITGAIIISIWFPLVFACIILLKRKVPITNKSLERIFYMHCYSFGGFVAIYTILFMIFIFIESFMPFGLTSFLSIHIFDTPIDLLALSVALTWLISFELQLYKSELVPTKRINKYILIFLSFLLASIFSAVTMWIFIGLFNRAI